jgi:hypothetical protein
VSAHSVLLFAAALTPPTIIIFFINIDEEAVV